MIKLHYKPIDFDTFDFELNNFAWIEDGLEEIMVPLHKHFAKRAIGFTSGRNRNVFIMPRGYVVKLPRCCDGIGDNDWEGSISNSLESIGDDDYVQYPKTRLIYYKEIPILFMEKVKPITPKETVEIFGYEPDWVNSVDCGQVGVNKHGRLVAYDYGLN